MQLLIFKDLLTVGGGGLFDDDDLPPLTSFASVIPGLTGRPFACSHLVSRCRVQQRHFHMQREQDKHLRDRGLNVSWVWFCSTARINGKCREYRMLLHMEP